MKIKKNVLIAIVGIPLLILSFIIDSSLFQIVNKIKNTFLDYSLGAVTHFGSVIIILIVMTSLFLWEERKREWIPVLWASFLISSLACISLKMVTARTRPFGAIASDFFGLVKYSFPSLHTTVAFAAVPILDKEFPKLKWFWIGIAIIIAFGRVYFKLHYLSDIIAGALLGYFTGALFVFMEERYSLFRKKAIFK